MDNYLPLTEASQRTRMAIQDLNQLAKNGKIKSVMMHNQLLLRESDVMAIQPEDNFEELKGLKIGISEAARKYGIHQQTISRWKDKGLLRVVEQVGQKILLDEAEVARMAAYYKSRPGRGRRTDIDLQK